MRFPASVCLVVLFGVAIVACGPSQEPSEPTDSTLPHEEIPAAPTTEEPRRLASGSPTNLLLISIDTTRIDRIGAYGYSDAITPHLDALAARGTRFDNAIAPMALTRPSHATMLTGLLPHSHGVWSNGPYRLEPQDHPFIEEFRQAGFQTAAVVASFVLSDSFGLGHGFGLFDDSTREIEGGDPEKGAAEVVAAATSWIQGPGQSPFLLWLHFYDPHYPYTPPEPFRSRFADDPYDGEIAFMDDAIGSFLERIEDRGWLADTLVAVVADHGEGLGERTETTHGYFLYDNTIRVPLILAGPGVPVGHVISEQVTLADLMPTFLEAFGLPVDSKNLDGMSFWSEMQRGLIQDRPAIVENRSLRNQFGWAKLSGVRTNDWKWIRAPQPELFDLRNDPAESRNLVLEEGEQASKMARLWAESRPADRQRERSGLTPEQEEKLSSLGYLSSGPASAQLPESTVDPKSVAAAIPDIERLIEARRANRSSEVTDSVERILRVDPTNLFALRVKGQLLVEQRNFEEAIAVLSPVVGEATTHPEAMAHLAAAYDGVGRERQAIQWYERSTTPPWIYWPALESLARIAARQPPGTLSERVLERLRDLTPTTARERLSVARGFALLGHFEPARGWFAQAVQADPGLTEASVGLAQMEARLGNLEMALQALSQVDVETVESTYVKGSVLAASGQKPQACEEFRKSWSLEPRNVNLLLGLGQQLGSCGLVDAAVQSYESALDIQPWHPVGLFELAQIAETRGEIDWAQDLYRDFLEVAPAQMDAQRSHATAFLAR